jgi:threonine dehydrogenase-like Zn-dependent dehydrogenase
VKAFRIERPGVAGIVEIDPPRIREDEVLLRVRAATICHGDQQILKGQRTEKVALPLVPGHEFAGTIEAVGSYVRGLSEGDAVACQGLLDCGRCDACRDGRTGVCRNYSELGCTLPGGFAELVAVPARCCHPAPGVPFPSLAAAEPTANAISAVEACGVEPGDTVAVIGIGPIALLALQYLKGKHPARLIAVGTREERLRVAASLGAGDCINARTTDAAAAIMRLTGGAGARRIIQCGPMREAFDLALAVTSFDAVIAVEAAPDTQSSWGVPIADIVSRHLSIVGVTGYSTGTYKRAVELIRQGAVDPSRVITHTFPLDRIMEAFALLESRREGVLKVAVIP